MPVYDTVLGAHLDTSGVAAVDIERANEQFARAIANGTDMSASDRESELELLRRIPGVRAELALEQDEGGRYLLVLERGAAVQANMRDSRARERFEPPRGEARLLVHPKPGVTIDDLLDVLHAGGVDDAETVAELDDDESVELPYHWRDREALTSTLARLGPLLREIAMWVRVEIDRRRYDVELDRTGVRCRGFHTISTETALAARFAALAGMTDDDDLASVPLATPPQPRPAPKFDPAQPLTTGTAQQRCSAWNVQTEYGRRSVADLSAMIAAVRDPANHDRRYANLRRDIYHYLAKHDTGEVHELFLWALREEDEEMASTVAYVGWRLESLVARLPEYLCDADSRGDALMVARLKRLRAEAGLDPVRPGGQRA